MSIGANTAHRPGCQSVKPGAGGDEVPYTRFRHPRRPGAPAHPGAARRWRAHLWRDHRGGSGPSSHCSATRRSPGICALFYVRTGSWSSELRARRVLVDPSPLSEVDVWLDRFRFWMQRNGCPGNRAARGKRASRRRDAGQANRPAGTPESEGRTGRAGGRATKDGHSDPARRRRVRRVAAITTARRPTTAQGTPLPDPERLGRWLRPVTGDLQLGGSFELDGGEHGGSSPATRRSGCECPGCSGRRRWWPGTSEVEFACPAAKSGTEFELVHAAVGSPCSRPTAQDLAASGWDLHHFTLAGVPR